MLPYTQEDLERFIQESNRIEGIRGWTEHEVEGYDAFLSLEEFGVESVLDIVHLVDPYPCGPELRCHEGMDVRVGERRPPPGGAGIRIELESNLHLIRWNRLSPYECHRAFERLHPFMDGNGRTGRLLWLWQMLHFDIAPGIEFGFLHAWYYQSLESGDRDGRRTNA